MITPLPGCTPAKPGSACFPFFGVVPVILDPETGREMEGVCEGYIAFKQPWPGIMRTVFGDHERFEKTYFSKFPGYYMSGDGAKRGDSLAKAFFGKKVIIRFHCRRGWLSVDNWTDR